MIQKKWNNIQNPETFLLVQKMLPFQPRNNVQNQSASCVAVNEGDTHERMAFTGPGWMTTVYRYPGSVEGTSWASNRYARWAKTRRSSNQARLSRQKRLLGGILLAETASVSGGEDGEGIFIEGLEGIWIEPSFRDKFFGVHKIGRIVLQDV
jgi:hypothetical protein